MRIALAVFLLVHGFAHLVGFLTPWGLAPAATSDTAAPANVVLGGRLTLGDAAARALGVLWLVCALAFAVAAVGVWRDAPWWPLGLAMTALASLVLSAAWWPVARIGVAVNVALLMLVIGLRFGGG